MRKMFSNGAGEEKENKLQFKYVSMSMNALSLFHRKGNKNQTMIL